MLDKELQGRIEGNETGIAKSDTNRTSLTTRGGTITAAGGSRAAFEVDMVALQGQLDGITGKVTGYIAAQILVLDNGVQGQFDGNDTDIATNVTNLTNLTTLVGTITDGAGASATVAV